MDPLGSWYEGVGDVRRAKDPGEKLNAYVQKVIWRRNQGGDRSLRVRDEGTLHKQALNIARVSIVLSRKVLSGKPWSWGFRGIGDVLT